MRFHPHVFKRLGLGYVANRPPNLLPRVFVAEEPNVADERRFRSIFGCTWERCTDLWELIKPENVMPKGYKPEHLLWGLLFLKVYTTEAVLTSMVGSPEEKTFRKWSRLFVLKISWLEHSVVSKHI